MGYNGFRTNATEDADIERDLARFTDKTKRIKEMYRLALAVERGDYVRVGEIGNRGLAVAPSQAPAPDPGPSTIYRPDPGKSLSWGSFPSEPSVKDVPPASAEAESLRKNMLGGF